MAAPVYRALDVPFGEGTFPGAATILFQAAEAPDVGPAREVAVEAGRRGTWVVTFRPGEALPAGSRVAFRKVENEFRFDWRHQDYWPEAMGYVTVEDAGGEALPFDCETALKSATPAIVTLPRDWESGEEIVVRIGDRRYGGPGVVAWPTAYPAAHLAVGVALPGEEAFRRAPEATLVVRTVPCPPVARYYLFAPSQAAPGQEFRAVALPVDANGNAIAGAEGVSVDVPAGGTAEVTPGPRHSLHIAATVRAEGVARLRLEDRENGLVAESNPMRVARAEGPGVYWGEFHCHGYDGSEINVLNEGTHPDSMYAYGRDVTRLDFVAMGSHIFRQAPHAVEEWWELYREAAARYDETGRYVTFMGCEWRDREDAGGDRNLVWRDLDAPRPDPTWRIEDLYRILPGQGAVVIPTSAAPSPFPAATTRGPSRCARWPRGTAISSGSLRRTCKRGTGWGSSAAPTGTRARPGTRGWWAPRGAAFSTSSAAGTGAGWAGPSWGCTPSGWIARRSGRPSAGGTPTPRPALARSWSSEPTTP